METCEYCDREIVESVPENAGHVACSGIKCGHMRVYGLDKEDCRQVIVRSDIKHV
jgi:hypothetical protein|tara:strand:+ start:186 stop:350 length:165 start_codon:yes stop_codon:yes gene_type:complete